MQSKNQKYTFSTNDQMIRVALRARLNELYKTDPVYRVVDEMSLNQGSVRADLAVINGVMHAYEIKSDRDNLLRLPSQAEAYNAIFDKVTIVVGFAHIYEVLNIIPDWWGVDIAKLNDLGEVIFSTIREPRINQNKDAASVASVLWKHEALQILESRNAAAGVRSKSSQAVYDRLASILDIHTLSSQVRKTLCSRKNWPIALTPVLSGD